MRWIKWAAGLFVLLTCSLASLSVAKVRAVLFSGGVSPETRGWQVATQLGCFQCHGWEGLGGLPNPGASTVPGFQDFNFLMSIYSESELEAWILDGAPARLDRSADPGRVLEMPGYRGRLNEGQLKDLKTYFQGVSGMVFPQEARAAEGFEIAKRKGCFGCHGVGGRLDIPNKGSLVGRIPAWTGPDFPELVQSDEELRFWILKGLPTRLETNRMAQYFLKRQTLKMPAYEGFLSESDLQAIMAYIHWLRDASLPGHYPKYGQPDNFFIEE
ncbi:MAG: c-type cytochrome [Acidobacteria bacterium]|nr:c-type cytochrome [Acidobacteriota bacterium]